MGQFFGGLEQLARDFQTYIGIFVVIGLLIILVLCTVGGEKGRAKAKEHIGWIIIGTGVGVGAFALSSYLGSVFGGSSGF